MPQSQLKASLLNYPRRFKQLLVLTVDLLMAWVAVVLAVDLRFEPGLPLGAMHAWLFLVAAGLMLPLFVSMGLYRAIFRYAGLQVIFSLNKALALFALLYMAVFTLVGVPGYHAPWGWRSQ